MAYYLGVDLGTTYTAAAVRRTGHIEMATLGVRAHAMPSVVVILDDGTTLVGEPAERRALTDPNHVAREFKRRLGDTAPMIVGGSPQSAERLTARLLENVVEKVSATEGGPPAGLTVTHPANWGPYRHDLLRHALELGGVADAALLSEPEAAAIHYASYERVDTGSVVAVYDLGGGTFDAALLRKTADGFELIGEARGIERLGGIDFDAALLARVTEATGIDLSTLDDDQITQAAVARLRRDVIDAKEALSSDAVTSVAVMLPGHSDEIRLTRIEFEQMIRPPLVESVETLRTTIDSAGLGVDDVDAVLLVGGSSRIPLVAQLVGAELNRPVSVDTHPKNTVALGAARSVGQARPAPPAPSPPPSPTTTPAAPPPPTAPPSSPTTTPAARPSPPTAPPSSSPSATPPTSPSPAPSVVDPLPDDDSRGSRTRRTLGLALAAITVALVAVIVVAVSARDDGTGESSDDVAPQPTASEPAPTSSTSSPTTTAAPATSQPRESIEEFAVAFDTAWADGDIDFLVERLSQETLDRYSTEQCRTHVSDLAAVATPLELREIISVGPWNYVTEVDGTEMVTTVANVTTVEVNRLIAGQTIIRETQWKLSDDGYTWFADCGVSEAVG